MKPPPVTSPESTTGTASDTSGEASAGPPHQDGPVRLPLPLRGPRTVLTVWLLLVVLAGIVASGTLNVLKSGGFDDPSSDSAAAMRLLREKFPTAQPNLFVLVRDKGGDASSTAATRAGQSVLEELSRESGVHIVASYYRTPDPALRSADGAGLTAISVTGDEDAATRKVKDLHTKLAGERDGVQVRFGGITQINNDLNDRTAQDLKLAESVAIPLTLLLLILVFRGVVAALLPLAVGMSAIVGAMAVLWCLGRLTSVSVFSTNLIIALGLGLAVDYSLLIVARYRQERAAGGDDTAALRRTLSTAGRTVIFSAVIVASVLLTLLVFPLYFLRSFAFAGVATVAITVLGALGPLPAMLLLLGNRVDKWPVLRARAEQADPERRLWGRIAGGSMRRPALWGLVAVAGLVVLALPLGHAQFGIPDERALPKDTESRQVAEALRTGFADGAGGDTISVVVPVWDRDPSGTALATYAQALSRVPGVDRVNSPSGGFAHGRPQKATTGADSAAAGLRNGRTVRLDLHTRVVPYSPEGSRLAERVRAVPVPGDRQVLVAGLAAQLVDTTSALAAGLPWALGLTVLITLVLLLLATGSVLLPVKAVLLNALGLAAVVGAMVWIFNDGHLSGLLGFTPSPLAITMPVLLVCVAYALSMDYEIFLLSRIKERHIAGDPTELSVRAGLGESGPLISAAAGLLAVSFFAIALSGVSLAKFFGLGTGIAILLDAVLIRGVLVPVFFRLAGPRAWQAPGSVKALTRRIEMAADH
ncbi:MMPL family transporter [Streptomyces sp. SA15]|uniref:MMPL family transporter n=1 Tax=Streptomyces sp. SA15 TaxID=934019 RepID=UPI00117CE9C1|nr:MMPL family transporter [Streptomyces sp. SA15]